MSIGLTAIFCPRPPDGPKIKFPIPLKSVDVSAFVVNACSHVRIRQIYENSTAVSSSSSSSGGDDRIVIRPGTPAAPPKTLECVYNFPIDPAAAVLGLRVVIGSTEIKTQVCAKKEARETYEAATKAGMKTTLLEQDEPDVATIYVGNLAPNEKALVELTYVSELSATEIDGIGFAATGRRALRFVLPTTIAPRYGERPTEGRPQTSYTIVPEAVVDYRLRFAATLRMSLGIESVVSPSHPNLVFAPKYEPAELGIGKIKTPVEVSVTVESVPLVKDLVLVIVPASEKQATSCVAWSDRFNELAVSNTFSPVAARSTVVVPRRGADEFVLVIDKSGSMEGEKIQAARDAASLFVNSLPSDSKFSIVAFSNDAVAFSQVLVSPDAASVAAAKKWIADIMANGGTETHKGVKLAHQILRADAVKTNVDDPTVPRRSIFVITDGEIGSYDECIKEIAFAREAGIRTFALGIGDAVSRGTISAIAMAGDGLDDTALPRESIVSKTMGMISKMRGVVVRDGRVSITPPPGWRVSLNSGAATAGRSLFAGTTNVSYAILSAERTGEPPPSGKMAIEVSYTVPGDAKRTVLRGEPDVKRMIEEYKRAVSEKARDGWMKGTVTVDLMQLVGLDVPDPFAPSSVQEYPGIVDGWMHALAAHVRSVHLTDQLKVYRVADEAARKTMEDEIRALGIKYAILTSETSFVGVGATLPAPGSKGPPTKILVPIPLATSETFFRGGGRGMTMQYAVSASPPGGGATRRYTAKGGMVIPESAAGRHPASAPPTREQMLTAMLLKQNADGSWPLDSYAAAKEDVEKTMRLVSVVATTVDPRWNGALLTLVILWRLSNEFGDMVDIWRAASEKAKAYIAGFDKTLVARVIEALKRDPTLFVPL